MNVKIRPASPGEREHLARIGLLAWRKGIGPLVTREVVTRIVANNPFPPFLAEQGPNVRVAVLGGQIAGFGAREFSDDLISDIWVDPAMEGRGVGSALIGSLETEISKSGFDTAKIEVAAGNLRALNLYRHLGFKIIWQKRMFDPGLGVSLEKIMLSKKL